MNRCKKVSSRTSLRNSVLASILVLVTGIGGRFLPWAQVTTPKEENLLGVIKVVSIRKMTDGEYAKRVSDYIGATHVVRLRFEAPGDRNVFLYAPYCGKPSGYVLERSAGKVTWLAAARGEDPSRSPGFKSLKIETGSCWLLMTAAAAYEWEEETEPRAPTEEARSVFVKAGKDQEPAEVISAWYTVSKDSQTPSTTR